mgnify:CR=1 FL=1
MDIDGYAATSPIAHIGSVGFCSDISDPTARHAATKDLYTRRIGLVKNAALSTDPVLCEYILKAVTEDLSFTYLKTKLGIPCGRSTYYKLYRKFFWLLNEIRD